MASDQMNEDLCPPQRLEALVDAIRTGEQGGMASLTELKDSYPSDPRLHFLEGSLLAGRGDYTEAQTAMRRAVSIAPDFAIARFQLGFLQLTCGDSYGAQESWGPLHGLPQGHYLRRFVLGLCHLIRDEFADAKAELLSGVAANTENPPLNNDMMLIVDEIGRKIDGQIDETGSALSSAQLLLQQASLKSTRH